MFSTLNPRMVQDHMYLTQSTYSNISHSRQQIWTDPLLLRRRAPNITLSPTEWSTGPYPTSLPNQPLKQWEKAKLLLTSDYYAYWAHKYQHAIDMFNTCSRGPTHRSLTDSGEGYSLEGAGFPCTTPWPSQPAVFTFHLRASPGLQFNQVLSTKPECWVSRTYDRHVVFRPLDHLLWHTSMLSHS
jgi:hypothetical protein